MENLLTGHATPESTAAVLLRCEELKSHLEATKGQLNQAAFQLEELTRILVSDKPASLEHVSRPWLDELVFGQLIEDVLDAERRLTEARAVAAEIGVPLPPDLK
jgi:hypothetical protein